MVKITKSSLEYISADDLQIKYAKSQMIETKKNRKKKG